MGDEKRPEEYLAVRCTPYEELEDEKDWSRKVMGGGRSPFMYEESEVMRENEQDLPGFPGLYV